MSTKYDSFTLIIDHIIDTYTTALLEIDPNKNIINLLIQLQKHRHHYGYDDSSIPPILNNIGKHLEEYNLSQVSLYFYQEQLRIEESHLGKYHPILADTLNSIGRVYANNDQLCEAAEYFTRAFILLKDNKQKGKLYALVLYNMGLVLYHQSLYEEATKTFYFALKEQQNALGEFHPDVADLHLNIGKLQLESGHVDNAMNNFLKALMIARMVVGNDCSKVSEILYYIGLSHTVNGEYDEALNSFYQSLEKLHGHRFEDKAFMITILKRIGTIYQNMGDIDYAINIFEQVILIIKDEVGEDHVCLAAVLSLLQNLYIEQGMVEKSKEASECIKEICLKTSEQSVCSSNDEFVEFVTDLFGYAIDCSSSPAAAAA